MKIIFFKSWKRKNSEKSFERLLLTVFVISLLTLAAAQLALSSTALRPLVAVDGIYEGTPISTEEYLYDIGHVTVELIKPKINPSIGILLNGEEISSFSESEITIEVFDGDVIEIDASNVTGDVEVRISGVSDNISRKYIGKSITFKSSVKILSQILF